MPESTTLYLLLADIILLSHVLFVAFVVIGLLLVLAGKVGHWRWVTNPWFRVVHLLSIGVVAAQSWIGLVCPLTTLEMALRRRAGDTEYAGTFVAHWLESLLYYRAPAWVFAVCYTAFAALVGLSWFWVRPRPFRGRTDEGLA